MRADTCMDLCMGRGHRANFQIDMCIDMCIDLSIDMGVASLADMSVDVLKKKMCVGSQHARRRAHRRAYRRAYARGKKVQGSGGWPCHPHPHLLHVSADICMHMYVHMPTYVYLEWRWHVARTDMM